MSVMERAIKQETKREPLSRIYRCCRDYALASWGDVFFVIWRENTTTAGVADLHSQCEKFASRRPRGILLLTLIHDGAPPPQAAERGKLAAFLRSANYIRGSAVIMEGTSFRAAFVRGVVTGLTMLARQPFPHQVCSMTGAGSLFATVTKGTDIEFQADSFERSIVVLRSRIDNELAFPSSRIVETVT